MKRKKVKRLGTEWTGWKGRGRGVGGGGGAVTNWQVHLLLVKLDIKTIPGDNKKRGT